MLPFAQVIRLVATMYARSRLSLWNVENLRAERGIESAVIPWGRAKGALTRIVLRVPLKLRPQYRRQCTSSFSLLCRDLLRSINAPNQQTIHFWDRQSLAGSQYPLAATSYPTLTLATSASGQGRDGEFEPIAVIRCFGRCRDQPTSLQTEQVRTRVVRIQEQGAAQTPAGEAAWIVRRSSSLSLRQSSPRLGSCSRCPTTPAAPAVRTIWNGPLRQCGGGRCRPTR